MKKAELRRAIAQAVQEHPLRKHVKKLTLFGSQVRGNATKKSDVDLLVEFDGSVSLFGLMQMEEDLSKALGMTVDLSAPSKRRMNKYFLRSFTSASEVVYEG